MDREIIKLYLIDFLQKCVEHGFAEIYHEDELLIS